MQILEGDLFRKNAKILEKMQKCYKKCGNITENAEMLQKYAGYQAGRQWQEEEEWREAL